MIRAAFSRFTPLYVSVLFGSFVVVAFALFVYYDTLGDTHALSKKHMSLFVSRWEAVDREMAHRAVLGMEFFSLSSQKEAIKKRIKNKPTPFLTQDIQEIDPVLARYFTSLGVACVTYGGVGTHGRVLLAPDCASPAFAYGVEDEGERFYFGFSSDAVFDFFKTYENKAYGLMLYANLFSSPPVSLKRFDDFFLIDPEGVFDLFLGSVKTTAWAEARERIGVRDPSIFIKNNDLFLFLPLTLEGQTWGYIGKKESLDSLVSVKRYVRETYFLLAMLLLTMFIFGYVMWRKKESLEEISTHFLRQKEQTEALVEQAEFGVAHLDMNGVLCHATEKFAQLVKTDSSALIGRNIGYVFGHAEGQRIIEKVRAGEKVKAHHYFCNLQGETIDLEALVSLNSEKTMVHYVVASRQEKTDLERLLMRTNLYFNHSDLGHIIADESFVVVECNDTLERLSGFSRAEILGKSMSMLFQTELLFQTWKKNYANPLSLPTGNGFEYKLFHKNKGAFWVEMFGNTFVEIGSRQYIFSIRDISVRVNARNTIRRLNESLQRQYDELETILEVIPLPLFIKDKNFYYVGCNEAFCSFFNIAKEELMGKAVNDLFPAEFAKWVQEKDDEMLKDNFQHCKSTVLLPHLGEEKVLEFHKKTLSKDGVFNGFVGVVVDITSKEREKYILKEAVRIEVEKNMQILEQHQEEKIKDAKFSSIGKMAAGITHEINTPLTYVKGNVELLRMDIEKLEEETLRVSMLEDTRVILEGLGRIANIIEYMREASQKSSETPEIINLFETLVHALVLSHNRAKQIVAIELNGSPFDLSVSKETYSFTCKVQKQRMEQVWLIILNNALDELIKIDAFEKRELSIWMRCEGDVITASFKDNGGGIASDIIQTLFEPFVSTKTSSGMGIGLNIAQKIVNEQGGSIRAFNHEKGAVFEVSVPCYKERG